MAIIKINDLRVHSLIGAYSWEKVNKQDLVINITIEYDPTKACRSDKLKDALDYQTVASKAIKIATRSHYTLLEKLAAKLLEGVMADKRVLAACVRLDKPLALAEARCVSFELSAVR